MKAKIISAFLLSALVLNLFLPIKTAHAATSWYVRSTGDGSPVPGNCPGVNCRLRDAIAAASAGDTIRFNLTVPSTIVLAYSQLVLDKNITIQSTGAADVTISGNNAFRIFFITTGVTATISGLTLTHGQVTGNFGGAVYVDNGANVSMANMVITQNTVVPSGGYEDIGGAAITNNGTLSISNSQVSNNTTPAMGAIYTKGGTTLSLNNVVMDGNQQQDGPNASAAIASKSAAISVFSTQVSPVTINLDTVTITNSIADTGAGAINSAGSYATLNLSNSTISDNNTPSSMVYIGGDSTATISNTTFGNNHAIYSKLGGEGYGGALYVGGTNNTVTVSNSSFTSNSASWDGGAIYVDPINTISLNNVTLTGNQSLNGSGGAIAAPSSTVSITDSNISSNSASVSGGGIYGNKLIITGSIVDGNTTTGHGGGVYIYAGGSVATPSITDTTISNNQSQMDGGGLYLAGNNNLTATWLTITGNTAGLGSSSSGGGVKTNFGSNLVLNKSTINGNSITGVGGGIAFYGAADLANITVSGNTATSMGGGIYAAHDSQLNQVTLAGNSSSYIAGGLFVSVGPTLNLQNSILADNTTTNNDPDCYGMIASLGFNLIETVSLNCNVNGTTNSNITGQDPALGALANNGGPTLTMLPQAGSPVIDTADNASCADDDQRGFLRPEDGDDDGAAECDMGAVEVDGGVAVQSVSRVNGDPTSSPTVDFTVTFTESVTGVDASDFSLTKTGTISGEGITNVNGAGTVYTITVNTGSGDGTLRLDIADNDSIENINHNPLGGVGIGNGNFTGGEVYTVIKSAPLLLAPAANQQLLNNRPTFDWTDFPGASSYQFVVSTNNKFSSLLLNKTLSTSSYSTTSDLPAGKTLYARVRAKVSGVYSAWSPVITFTTAIPPSVPVLKVPTNGALSSTPIPVMDWTNSTAPLGTAFHHYQVQISTLTEFSTILLESTTFTGDDKASSFAVSTPLDKNTKYYWRVRSFNYSGQYSNWSTVFSFRVKMDPPDLVSPVNTFVALSLRPSFDWNAPAGPGAVTGYTIQFSKNSTFTQIVHTGNPVASDYVPTVDLTRNATLYWRVLAKGSNGPSDWSVARSFHSPNPPTTPILVSPASNTLLSLDMPLLKWKAVTLPSGTSFQYYELQVDDTADFSSTLIDDISITNSLTVQFTPAAPLAHNTKYYWRLRAVNINDELGNWSVTRTFRIQVDAPTLQTPANGTGAGSFKPTFDWMDAVGPGTIKDYTIQVSVSPTFGSFAVNSTTINSSYTLIKDLLPGKTYYWRVRVNGANGPSVWSTVYSFTTP